MLKKILIGVVILIIVGIGASSYIFVRAVEDKVKEKEPELRQYITMTVEEQNAYVEKNIGFFMDYAGEDAKEEAEVYKHFQDDAELKAAAIACGRSFAALAITETESLAAGLDETLKAKFKAEGDEFSARLDKYSELAKKYEKPGK